jgi:tRNA-2-methylthio-N6-dimethylallyladenosine synthase
MRRRYTREHYLDLLDKIRKAIPNVQLSTDMIVGFPGETAEDFEQTLSLTSAAEYHSMFSFKYSVRPNTLASARMADDVPEQEKTARIVALQSLQREIQSALHARSVGHDVEVLVDSASRRRRTEVSGRTTGNTVVNFPVPSEVEGAVPSGVEEGSDPASWIGRTVLVRVKRAGPNSVWGEAVATGERKRVMIERHSRKREGTWDHAD